MQCNDDDGTGYYGVSGREQVCHNISSTDAQLCSNHTFWSNVPCTRYNSDGSVGSYGLRCTGAVQRCVYPWFTLDNGGTAKSWCTQSCDDKSDQIIPQNITFHQYNKLLLDEHNKLFCNDSKVKNKEICIDSQSWFSKQNIPDIHKCQDSCKAPGPNCTTCQNPKYFQCKVQCQENLFILISTVMIILNVKKPRMKI